MSDKAAIVIGFLLLLATFLGSLIFNSSEEIPELAPPATKQPEARFSGNSHDRRLARRQHLRTATLAPGQTPTRGARGRWDRVASDSSAFREQTKGRQPWNNSLPEKTLSTSFARG